MALNDKNSVMVELYDLSITDRKDDRFGRVVKSKTINEEDLVALAVDRRTDLNPSTLKAAMDILRGIAIEQIANGASVNFGLGYYNLAVNGVFIGDNARWDSAKHNLSVRVTPTAELRNVVNACSAEVRGMATSGLVINSITDVSSGEENSRLTPGGGINIVGSKIKIAGDDPSVGIKLINQANQEETVIPMTSILVNNPTQISAIVPATLAAGDYELAITTQFTSAANMLKNPRTYVFEYILDVTA